MSFVLGKRSLSRLEGVHPDLIRVVKLGITLTTVDFAVLEGVRTMTRQRKLFQSGASQIMDSRHLLKVPLNQPELGAVSHAVDLGAWVDGEVRWDWPLYYPIANAMKMAALEEDVMLGWGGDWKTFKDGPHYELPKKVYPT